jgi:hypothetical protein
VGLDTITIKTEPVLELDEESHIYTLSGVRLPSVTQILTDAGMYPGSAWYTEGGRERGTRIHELCELYDLGVLEDDMIDYDVLPYIEGYKKFRVDSGFVPTEIEKKVCSQLYWYAGKLDRKGILNGKSALIDLKSGRPTPADALQTAAYVQADDEMTGLSEYTYRYALYLKNNGSYRLTEHTDRNDINIFLAATALYRWKKEKGLIKEA